MVMKAVPKICISHRLFSRPNMAILIQTVNEKAEIKVVRVPSKRVPATTEKTKKKKEKITTLSSVCTSWLIIVFFTSEKPL